MVVDPTWETVPDVFASVGQDLNFDVSLYARHPRKRPLTFRIVEIKGSDNDTINLTREATDDLVTLDEKSGILRGHMSISAFLYSPFSVAVCAIGERSGKSTTSFRVYVEPPVSSLVKPIKLNVGVPFSIQFSNVFPTIVDKSILLDSTTKRFYLEALPEGTGINVEPCNGTLFGIPTSSDLSSSPSSVKYNIKSNGHQLSLHLLIDVSNADSSSIPSLSIPSKTASVGQIFW